MNIERIIYNTCRNLNNVEDKLGIATIFLFCEKIGQECFAELLFTKDHNSFINKIREDYKAYDIVFNIDLNRPNIKDCFYKTLEEVVKNLNDGGFCKAVYKKDPFALMIINMIKNDFNRFDFKNTVSELNIK